MNLLEKLIEMVTSQELLQLSNTNPLASGFFGYQATELNESELMEEEVMVFPDTPQGRYDEYFYERDRPDRPEPEYERPMDWQYEDEGYYHPYADRYEGSFGGQTWSYSDETLPERSPFLG